MRRENEKKIIDDKIMKIYFVIHHFVFFAVATFSLQDL